MRLEFQRPTGKPIFLPLEPDPPSTDQGIPKAC
jgi:hypothetical protein